MQMYDFPDARGHFGPYGGIFVAETLIEALEELRAMYDRYRNDPEFLAEFEHDLKYFVGRPSPVYHAKHIPQRAQWIRIVDEDENHCTQPADRKRDGDCPVQHPLRSPETQDVTHCTWFVSLGRR